LAEGAARATSLLFALLRSRTIAAFTTLHLYQSELDQTEVLLDVRIIADEVDAQLTETMRSFMAKV
jgi:hypothetical protein